MNTNHHDRGQGGIRALFFLGAIFLFLLFAMVLVAAPLFDGIMPVVESSSAAQNADWIPMGGVSNFMSTLRLTVLVGGTLVVFGMSVAWVVAWYIKTQARVGA